MKESITIDIQREDLIRIIGNKIPKSKWLKKSFVDKELGFMEHPLHSNDTYHFVWKLQGLKKQSSAGLYQIYYMLTQRDFDANEKIN